MPTDCGPTDTLEVGINFFVENVEKANTKWGNESSFFSFVIFASFFLFRCCLSVFFLAEFPHVEGGEGQGGTLFLSDSHLGRSVLLSVFLSYFLFLSHSPLSLTLLTSTLWVQPTWLWAKINAHMCLQLLYTGLMKVRREKERQMSKIQRL